MKTFLVKVDYEGNIIAEPEYLQDTIVNSAYPTTMASIFEAVKAADDPEHPKYDEYRDTFYGVISGTDVTIESDSVQSVNRTGSTGNYALAVNGTPSQTINASNPNALYICYADECETIKEKDDYLIHVYAYQVEENTGKLMTLPTELSTVVLSDKQPYVSIDALLYHDVPYGTPYGTGGYYGTFNMNDLTDTRVVDDLTSVSYIQEDDTHKIVLTGDDTVTVDKSNVNAIYLVYTAPQSANPEDVDVNKAPDHFKRIDWLGDGVDNMDTTIDDGDDDMRDNYRLYLDVGPESAYAAIDVLFILDRSTSMATYRNGQGVGGDDATDILGYKTGDKNGLYIWRAAALNSMLNGLTEEYALAHEGYTGDQQYFIHNNHERLFDNGLIQKLRDLNPANKMAVGIFSLTAEEIMPWGAPKAITDNTSSSGTNYCRALELADSMLQNPAVKNDGREKILVFLSDGEPTTSYSVTTASSTNQTVKNETNDAIDAFAKKYSNFGEAAPTEYGVSIVTVAIGSDADIAAMSTFLDKLGDPQLDENGEPILDRQGNRLGGTMGTRDFGELVNYLDNKITRGVGHYTKLKVRDQLSEDVEFYLADETAANIVDDENLQLIVQKVPTNGYGTATEILWENGHAVRDKNGEYLVDNVTIDKENKKIEVTYTPSVEELGGYKYSISFNVKVPDGTYVKYTDNMAAGNPGYYDTDENKVITGDIGTDYRTNDTSSEHPGFYSNTDSYIPGPNDDPDSWSGALLTYTQNREDEPGTPVTVPFDMPVVQVAEKNIKAVKVWSDIEENNHADDWVDVKLWLKRDTDAEAEEFGTARLNASNNWEHTFEDLPDYSTYIYTVEETGSSVDPAEYSTTYDWSEENLTYTIINTKIEGVIFRKTTQLGGALRVSGVVFDVYTDEQRTQLFGEFTTDENGEFVFTGYEVGKQYWISEKTPPAGFLPMEPRAFTINSDGIVVPDHDKYLSVTSAGVIEIKNYNGTVLPATGGFGKEAILSGGIATLVTAAYVGMISLIKRRKKAKA